MALISLGQIAIGCLLTAYGGVQLGMSCIKNGINDMVTTIKSAFKGSFDWGAWAIQKGIEIMIAVASYGINVAKEAIKGAQTTAESVKEGMLSANQAIKDIIKDKRLKDLTIETATGEITKAPQQIIKETLTTQLKQRAVGELIDKTSQCLADELWVKQQAKKIRRVVRQALTDAFTTNELITHALKVDRDQQNSSWQQCFLGEAQQVLEHMLKFDPANKRLQQIGKGVVHNTVPFSKEAEVAAGGLNAIIKSLSDSSDTIAPLTNRFIEAFNKRIATYKSDIEQSKQANQVIQETVSRSNPTTAMAESPPVNLYNEAISIAEVNAITDFRAPDRSPIRLEESFPNLGPSTPENLVSELEEYLCGATIQKLNNEVMSGASYGASYLNDQLFKKANEANQAFLKGLEARGVSRYKDIKTDKKQYKLTKEQEQKGGPSADQSQGKQQTKLEADAEKGREAFTEDAPLTVAHIRVAAHLVERPIHIIDEHGEPVGNPIGDAKPGEPILLRVIHDKKGGLSHMEPLNLTPAQKAQYEGLSQTKNDCALNAIFVHLSKEKQVQVKDIQGMRQACADHIKAHPKVYRDLFKYQEKLRQLAPDEVASMGFLPVMPVVKAGLAAWTAYQLYATGRDMVHDAKVLESWKKSKYIDTIGYGARHLPVVGDAICGGRSLAQGDYRGAWLWPANALFTLYGGKVIGKGGRWLVNRTTPKINKLFGQLGGGKGLTKQGRVLKNDYYEINGLKFSEYYYNKLWSTGRGAPSLMAKEILKGGSKTAVPDLAKKGFNKYVYGGWEMVYNPTTKEVWHLKPIKPNK